MYVSIYLFPWKLVKTLICWHSRKTSAIQYGDYATIGIIWFNYNTSYSLVKLNTYMACCLLLQSHSLHNWKQASSNHPCWSLPSCNLEGDPYSCDPSRQLNNTDSCIHFAETHHSLNFTCNYLYRTKGHEVKNQLLQCIAIREVSSYFKAFWIISINCNNLLFLPLESWFFVTQRTYNVRMYRNSLPSHSLKSPNHHARISDNQPVSHLRWPLALQFIHMYKVQFM
jgi:hypothetical protein